jgi:preprotein translocase subunit SecA
VKDLYDPREQWASYLINAMKAKELFLKDVSYIVRNKQVVIVDEFTGRVMQVFIMALLTVWTFMLKQQGILY